MVQAPTSATPSPPASSASAAFGTTPPLRWHFRIEPPNTATATASQAVRLGPVPQKLGNYHCWNRQYDIQTARWTTPDPAASPWSNLRDFVGGRPVSNTDPSGLEEESKEPWYKRLGKGIVKAGGDVVDTAKDGAKAAGRVVKGGVDIAGGAANAAGGAIGKAVGIKGSYPEPEFDSDKELAAEAKLYRELSKGCADCACCPGCTPEMCHANAMWIAARVTLLVKRHKETQKQSMFGHRGNGAKAENPNWFDCNGWTAYFRDNLVTDTDAPPGKECPVTGKWEEVAGLWGIEAGILGTHQYWSVTLCGHTTAIDPWFDSYADGTIANSGKTHTK